MTPLSTELSTHVSTACALAAERWFDRYAYPPWLRVHSRVVGRIAGVLALAHRAAGADLDVEAVTLAGYLHDVGRSPLLAGVAGEHEERSALVLVAEGQLALAELARRHPVYAPLDPARAPRTLAEKIVNVADRRGGQQLVTIVERVREMAERHPEYLLEVPRALAHAAALEREVFAGLPFGPDELKDALGDEHRTRP